MTGFANWAKLAICDPQPSLVLTSKVRSDLSSVFNVLSLPWRWLGAVAEHLGWSNPTALKWLKSSFVCSYLQNRRFQEFGENRFSNSFCLILMLKHDFSRCFSLESPFADSNKNKFFEFKILTFPKITCLDQFSAARPVTKWSQNGRKIEKFSKSPKCCFWANFWWKSWFDQF